MEKYFEAWRSKVDMSLADFEKAIIHGDPEQKLWIFKKDCFAPFAREMIKLREELKITLVRPVLGKSG